MMTGPPTISRRALLSAGGGCFAGSLLLDSWLFGAAATDGSESHWQQRWGDATQRKFTPASPDPDGLEQTWSVSPDNTSLTVESVDPDRVYVRDYDRLIAYNRTDGTREWTYAATLGTFTLPSLVGNTLLVQENTTVHAVASDDGAARWTGEFFPSHQPLSTIVTLDGDAYLPGQRSYFEIEPGTGFQRRTFDAKALGTLVAAADTQLFWWADGRLRATDTTGDIQWTASFGRSHPPSGRAIAVTEREVVLRHISPDDGPTVTALDRDSGDRLWNATEGIDSGVAVTAGPETVYVGTDLRVRALDLTTGESLWTRVTGRSTPQPVATPETVYAPTTDGVVPVDPATGDQSGAVALDGKTVRSLAVVGDGIYAVADERLFALEVAA